jgi:hypothetical protein
MPAPWQVAMASGAAISYGDGPPTREGMHRLREALRATLWRCAELQRSTFEGAAPAVNLPATQPLLGMRGGPTLLTDGVWTEIRAHAAGLLDGFTCQLCNEAPGTLVHALWECQGNAFAVQARAQLVAAHPALADAPRDIPKCLALAGIVPADLPAALTRAAPALQQYLLGDIAHRDEVLAALCRA